MTTSHAFTEPRVCTDCDAFDIEFDQRLCPFCDEPTQALSDYEEARWDRHQEDAMSEPVPSMAALHRAAWEDREALRSGRAF